LRKNIQPSMNHKTKKINHIHQKSQCLPPAAPLCPGGMKKRLTGFPPEAPLCRGGMKRRPRRDHPSRALISQKIHPPHFIELIRRKRNLIRRMAGSKMEKSRETSSKISRCRPRWLRTGPVGRVHGSTHSNNTQSLSSPYLSSFSSCTVIPFLTTWQAT